jgi:signal transduction histidine kinase
VALTFWADLTLAELERRVARLPPRSAIYILTISEDSSGARFIPLEARARLAAVANAPIYVWNQAAHDNGVVGGRVFSNQIVAAHSAQVALRILRGERAADMAVTPVDPSVTQLDWRELQRWKIDAARVPGEAVILFREPSLWDRYKVYVSTALALMLLQTALITGLLVQRTRRRHAEVEMRKNQDMLQASNRQISDLFGRLIAAQETERSRIARELHDDVSQRIAALSISMSTLKRKLSGHAEGTDPIAALAVMQRDTTALAEEIRHVSHDLHPSALQHAGLISALQGYCSQFSALHGLAITFRAETEVGAIDGDTALCLYRVTQEALHNVAKHARAKKVSVILARTGDAVQLSIADDGIGFTLSGTRGHGLGLISIDERVRLLGGDASIDTRPGGGTQVEVKVPGGLLTG